VFLPPSVIAGGSVSFPHLPRLGRTFGTKLTQLELGLMLERDF